MAEVFEWSRPVRLDTLGEGPRTVRIEADASERAALARRFGLIALDAIAAEVTLARTGEIVRCEGRLSAAAVQACVASGEPVPARVDEDFALRFVPDLPRDDGEEEVELDLAELDDLPYSGGSVDVGEAAAQTLALALDPFPRAAGADIALRDAGVMDEADAGPFAMLKALKGKL